jgi:type II secretory pathway component GspD/PulD (secretin)
LTAGTADQGLILNLRQVTVDQALNFLTEKAGFILNRQTQTAIPGTVDVVSDDPIGKAEIVALYNKILASHGLTVIQDGKTLTIETVDEAEVNADTHVNVVTNWQDIPADAQVVTEVIPVHTLNPTQVVKDLYTLIPPGAKMNTSEAGTSVLMTGSQADIRRFAQIIAALDSTGNGDLQVFLLQFADSKAIASELKDVFTADNTGTQGNNNPFAAFVGGRGGRGGGGAAAAGSDESRRTGVHVNAVSDDQNNAVLVSAPADFMGPISNIIFKLDIPQEDTVQIRLFFLTNADCNDVVNELLTLFPDPNTQSGAAAGATGRRGAAQVVGGRGGAGAGSTMSDRLKKQATVNAVADPRTQAVLVTASKDTMTQIEQIINEMDLNPSGHVQVFYYKPMNADVLDMVNPLTDLFPPPTGRSTSTTSQQNMLLQRQTTAASTTSITSSTTIGSSSGGGGGGATGR